MDGIKALVQVLVVIIVLAVFIEMLLPNSNMHDYVKMVMGLMVIVVVLEAGAGMVNKDFKFDLPAMTGNAEGTPGLERILEQGQRLAETKRQQAMEEYRQGLEKQVLALARLQQDLNVTGATITTAGNSNDRELGRLTEIVLEISPDKQEDGTSISKVKPVDITVGASSGGGEDKAKYTPINDSQARELARTVANFYNIPEDQVKIVEAK
ncbi:hypothetical protein N752_13565 [Desulforamulus aquiferis]|nr:hypothetical protein N752_13565 [Desulforamulus aquiferis]